MSKYRGQLERQEQGGIFGDTFVNYLFVPLLVIQYIDRNRKVQNLDIEPPLQASGGLCIARAARVTGRSQYRMEALQQGGIVAPRVAMSWA